MDGHCTQLYPKVTGNTRGSGYSRFAIMGIWLAMLLVAKMLAESARDASAMGARLESIGLTCGRVSTTQGTCSKLRMIASPVAWE